MHQGQDRMGSPPAMHGSGTADPCTKTGTGGTGSAVTSAWVTQVLLAPLAAGRGSGGSSSSPQRIRRRCMHLLAILLLALVTPAAAKGSAGSGGGRGDGGGGGGTSSAGSGGTRTSSSSSSSSSGYHIYQPSGSLYSGSTAYRAYPVSSVAFVAVYGPGSHYYYYASPHYTGGTVENCTMVCLCNATNATNASSTAAAASPSSSTLQASSVTDPTTFFTRVLPLVADNNTDFDDFNSTVYDASNQTFFASDCTITTYGSGTSSAAALPPRSTVFMLVSALLAWWFMTALLG